MKEYLIKKDGKYKGAMAFDVIIEGINNGKLEGADLVWYEGVIDWDRLDKAEDFKHLFNKKNPIISTKTDLPRIQAGKKSRKVAPDIGISKKKIPTLLIVGGILFLGFAFLVVLGLIMSGSRSDNLANSDEMGTTSSSVLKWRSVATVGKIKVRVKNVSFGTYSGTSPGGTIYTSENPAIGITLSIETDDNTKIYSAKGSSNSAILSDQFENSLTSLSLKAPSGFTCDINGQLKWLGKFPIRSNEPLTDFLVFSKPVEAATNLILTLDADNFGGHGKLQFEIPYETWSPSSNGIPFDTAMANLLVAIDTGVYANVEKAVNLIDKKWVEKLVIELNKQLDSKNPKARAVTVLFLGNIYSKSTQDLTKVLEKTKDPDPAVRIAAYSLANTFTVLPDKALLLAKEALSDKEETVQAVGVKILLKYQKGNRSLLLTTLLNLMENSSPVFRDLISNDINTMEPVQESDLSTLEKYVNSKNNFVAGKICRILGKIKNLSPKALPSLVLLVDHPEASVSVEAIRSIGAFGNKASTLSGMLLGKMKTENPEIRKEVLVTLSKISRDQSVVAVLVDSLGDDNYDVAQIGTGLITKLSPPLGALDFPAIEEKFNSKNIEIRKVCYKVLALIGKTNQNPVADAAAVSGLEDISDEIKEHSLDYLVSREKLSDGLITKAVELLDKNYSKASGNGVTGSALAVLAKGGQRSFEAVPVLKKIITTKQTSMVLEKSYNLMSSIGPESSVLIPDLFSNVLKPEIPATGESQAVLTLSTYRRLFLESGDNEKIRSAISFMGKSAAKNIASNFNNPDPVMRFFSLLAAQSIGKDAKELLPAIFKMTVPLNEKAPLISQQARETYGVIKGLTEENKPKK